MGSGEDDAGQVERTGGEIESIGGAQSDVGDVRALAARAVDERLDELCCARAHIVPHEDLLPDEVAESCAQAAGDRGGQLVGYEPANIVRLDDVLNSVHEVQGSSSLRMTLR